MPIVKTMFYFQLHKENMLLFKCIVSTPVYQCLSKHKYFCPNSYFCKEHITYIPKYFYQGILHFFFLIVTFTQLCLLVHKNVYINQNKNKRNQCIKGQSSSNIYTIKLPIIYCVRIMKMLHSRKCNFVRMLFDKFAYFSSLIFAHHSAYID